MRTPPNATPPPARPARPGPRVPAPAGPRAPVRAATRPPSRGPSRGLDAPPDIPPAPPPHVVILGGGFGGLNAARTLARYPVRITIVDRHNHHLFQPLLYQVATAALSPGEIAVPIRAVLRKHRNVQVMLAEATAIDLESRRVTLDRGELTYDYLVVAAGSTHSYFGHQDWEALAPGLKTLEDALGIRQRILRAFEQAELENDPDLRAALLTFVVVGGGPTGVEMAGAIAEMARQTLREDFRRIDPAQSHVILVEAMDRVLPTFPTDLSAAALRQLWRVGVEVRLGAQVTQITPESVTVGEETIPTRTTLWAAGVAASPLARSLGVPLDRAGRVTVEPDLTLPGHPEVYVVGDLALFTHQAARGQRVRQFARWRHDDRAAGPLPGVAPVAIQQGRAAADNIWRTISFQERLPFRYHDRGSLATIGRAAGVADLGPLRLSGTVAWLAWLVVHIYFLIGFENRVLVMIRWAWAYFTHHRGARLITGNPS